MVEEWPITSSTSIVLVSEGSDIHERNEEYSQAKTRLPISGMDSYWWTFRRTPSTSKSRSGLRLSTIAWLSELFWRRFLSAKIACSRKSVLAISADPSPKQTLSNHVQGFRSSITQWFKMTSTPPHIRIRSCTIQSPWQRVPRTRTMSRFTYAKPVGSSALCVAGTEGPALAKGDGTAFPNTIRGRKRSRSRRNSGVIVIVSVRCHYFWHTDALFDCSTSFGECLQTFPQFSGYLLSFS